MRRRILRIAFRTAMVGLMVSQFFPPMRSHHTAWPGYSAVAPVSWLIAQDVQEGRSHLNFSEWGGLRPESALANVREMCQEVRDQKMPPWYYLPLHPASKLSQTEITTLCAPSLTGFAE